MVHGLALRASTSTSRTASDICGLIRIREKYRCYLKKLQRMHLSSWRDAFFDEIYCQNADTGDREEWKQKI